MAKKVHKHIITHKHIHYKLYDNTTKVPIYLIYGQINEHFLKGITSQYKYIAIYV